jgi:hypothetical protein
VEIDKAIEIMQNSAFTSFRPKKGITSNVPEMIGDWSSHVNSWLNAKDLPLVLIKYEDLLKKPIETLSKIMQALNQPTTDAVLASAVKNHSFQSLAEQESNSGFREKIVASGSFFRKGRSGSWKEELTTDQVNQVVQSHQEVMNTLGYTNY